MTTTTAPAPSVTNIIPSPNPAGDVDVVVEVAAVGVVVIGVVVDYVQNVSIPPQNDWHDVDITYIADCGGCSADPEEIFETELTACSDLGEPSIPCMIAVGSDVITLYGYDSGHITITPSGSAELFVRGYVN